MEGLPEHLNVCTRSKTPKCVEEVQLHQNNIEDTAHGPQNFVGWAGVKEVSWLEPDRQWLTRSQGSIERSWSEPDNEAKADEKMHKEQMEPRLETGPLQLTLQAVCNLYISREVVDPLK